MVDKLPNYDNLRADSTSMQRFFKDSGVQISAENSKIIASVFEQCDTEGKTDANGKQTGDGQLTGNERTKFLSILQNILPEKIYSHVVDFLVTVDVAEDIAKEQEETQKGLDEETDISTEQEETKKRLEEETRRQTNEDRREKINDTSGFNFGLG